MTNGSDGMLESADRDANRRLHDRLVDVYGRYTRLRSDMDELQNRLTELRVTAASPNGRVRATVGPRGQLVDLQIDPRAIRPGDGDRLACVILATVSEAARCAADQVEGLMADYLPTDSGALRFLRDNNFASLMRRPDAALRNDPAGDHE